MRRGPGLLVFVMLASGCAAPAQRGHLIFGQWEGEGSFAYERWAGSAGASSKAGAESLCESYPTTLTILPGQLDGHEVIKLQVQSDRGPIADLGDHTDLRVALVKAKRVSNSTVLYRLVGFQFNPTPQDQPEYDDGAPPYSASCTTLDGVTTFHIEYLEGFVETFRFRGDRLEKSGMFSDRKQGLVHWYEQLTRR